jgi:hypothetical protein
LRERGWRGANSNARIYTVVLFIYVNFMVGMFATTVIPAKAGAHEAITDMSAKAVRPAIV